MIYSLQIKLPLLLNKHNGYTTHLLKNIVKYPFKIVQQYFHYRFQLTSGTKIVEEKVFNFLPFK